LAKTSFSDSLLGGCQRSQDGTLIGNRRLLADKR
jgi:hypothetical protein